MYNGCYNKSIDKRRYIYIMELNNLIHHYEELPHDSRFTFNLSRNLLEDYKKLHYKASKAIRALMIEYIHNKQDGKKDTNLYIDGLQEMYNTFEDGKHNATHSIKLPKQLLEDFKAVTPNANKTIRLLMIIDILKRRQQNITNNNVCNSDKSFMDLYYSYEMLDNNDTQAYRMPPTLLEDFKAITTNQAKTIRKLIIEFIYNQHSGKTQKIEDKAFSLLVEKYKEEQSTSRLAFKLPSKLLEDFKAVTPNQSKTLRLLLIEYIYKHKQQQ